MSAAPQAAGRAPLREVGALRLTFVVLGGLLAWLARIIAGAASMGFACDAGWGVAALLSQSALALGIGSWALVSSLQLMREGREPAEVGRHDARDGGYTAAGWLGLIGFIMNATALLAVLAESVPIVLIDPCAGT